MTKRALEILLEHVATWPEEAEEELVQSVKKHSWENVPKEEKGRGRFYRKASPGSWRDDLTPRQAQIVENLNDSLLRELYAEWS